MFVSRKTHEALIRAMEAQVSSLRSEVEFLRNMVQPRRGESSAQVEADLVLEGRQDQVASVVTEKERQRAVDLEAARILDGTY